jgi:hypothetical protein
VKSANGLLFSLVDRLGTCPCVFMCIIIESHDLFLISWYLLMCSGSSGGGSSSKYFYGSTFCALFDMKLLERVIDIFSDHCTVLSNVLYHWFYYAYSGLCLFGLQNQTLVSLLGL